MPKNMNIKHVIKYDMAKSRLFIVSNDKIPQTLAIIKNSNGSIFDKIKRIIKMFLSSLVSW